MAAQRHLAVVGGDDLVTLRAEELGDHAHERRLVVDDEDDAQRAGVAEGATARARGMLNANTAPTPGGASTQMSPPCASTTRRDAKSPMPDPGAPPCAGPAPRAPQLEPCR